MGSSNGESIEIPSLENGKASSTSEGSGQSNARDTTVTPFIKTTSNSCSSEGGEVPELDDEPPIFVNRGLHP